MTHLDRRTPAESRLTKSAARILRAAGCRPKLALVLGSGFQAVREEIQPIAAIPYSKLPGFPRLHVPGHVPCLVVGRLAGVEVLALCGRAHYYEGYPMEAVTFPIRVLAKCGISDLLLTNAAGGINPKLRPGDLMCLADHVNLMGVNPLLGTLANGKSNFVDLTQTYDPELNRLLKKAAAQIKERLFSGVYFAVSGPSFETPAEIRAFAKLGADAVGMSTVPEAIVARSCGLNVAAIFMHH